ncbi:hypothetical protein PENSPDRAFT_748321 [Peniophora sp. CONT]|nr:hypothetical protein PENSPDRAFT_748321 [Peniophora sp. CONT]
MESIPARPGSPLPPLSGRATHLMPTRRAPVAPPSGTRSRPPLARTKSSANVLARQPPSASSPQSTSRNNRSLLARSKSSADLPSLLAPAPPPATTNRIRPTRNGNENILAAFPEPPPLARHTTDLPTMRTSPSYLKREKPSAHQAKRITVPTASSQRSPQSSRVAELEEATVASSPVICPALPVDLVPYSQRYLRRSPPRSPRALRETKRGSPLKRGWSAEDMLREMEQDNEIDLLREKDGWFMQALQECAEDEDEDDYFKSFSRSVVSVQEVPDDCDIDSDEEEDPFHFDRNVSYRR